MKTICASSTAQGGAIGMIRISGDKAILIASKVFVSINNTNITEANGYTLHYGKITDNKTDIDDVLLIIYRSPRSYTGEDTVEIMCHGSAYIIQTIQELLITNGCTMAQPGEFTQRAFMNGKMDLSQAEAVADLIASSNQATHRLAMSQMRGGFSNELRKLRDQLLEMTTLLELELDFSEEDVEFADRQKLLSLAQYIDSIISRLVDSFKKGNAIKNGVPVAIIGETNVGKSTLLNSLLHEDKAIVSDIHGTTRDSIEDCINIGGTTFRFIDTAGIRNTSDEIEQLGIERSWKKAEDAEIIILVSDTDHFDLDDPRLNDKKIIKVRNKSDLAPALHSDDDTICISAKYGNGIDLLEQRLLSLYNIDKVSESDVIVTNLRHVDALRQALTAIKTVENQLQQGISGDIISMDLRSCIDALATITGDISSDDTLHNIFHKFCIGK